MQVYQEPDDGPVETGDREWLFEYTHILVGAKRGLFIGVDTCGSRPFSPVDDWFIGTNPMNAAIPKTVQALTLKFE